MAPSASPSSPAEQLNKPQSKAIANPRRLLILTPTSQSASIIPPLLHSLTGVPVTEPPQHAITSDTSVQPPLGEPHTSISDIDAEAEAEADKEEETLEDKNVDTTTSISFAGYTTHAPLRLDTKYYTADIPLWVDEIPLTSEVPKTTTPVPATVTTTTEQNAPSVPGQWRTEFLSEDAQIVRDALGALVVCVRRPEAARMVPSSGDRPGTDAGISSRADVCAVLDLMRDVGAVKGCIDEERGGAGDVVGVFVLVGKKGSPVTRDQGSLSFPSFSLAAGERDSDMDGIGNAIGDGEDGGDTPLSVGWWEDQLFDLGLFGWEVVEWDPMEQGEQAEERTRNQFGEYEGMPRIKEVLETHDWSTPSDMNDLDDADFDFDDENDLEEELLGFGRRGPTSGFGQEVQELEREMMGLRMAIERGGGDGISDDEEPAFDHDNADEEERKVESIEALMMRMQAIRDMGSDLPEAERRRFAAKAVSEVMREL
ncbi:hypothetical protein PDE_03948 [Penicillium oxalicum 114-2]|uniref:Alpha and gamma adaptin binding protein p34 n=1 Tax=Penicillium oxalicum (strain 114-2 / CGMCC 5302) TaxID=933388 RepID=S8B3D1_PENO1|nr:hypothetical protein PDE_03948 [Penicillium oxalicum 114-2]